MVELEWHPISIEQYGPEGIVVKRRQGTIAKTVEVHESVMLDFDADGNLLEVEVLASPRRGTQ